MSPVTMRRGQADYKHGAGMKGSSHNVVHIQSGTTTLADTEPTMAKKGEEENQIMEVVTKVIV